MSEPFSPLPWRSNPAEPTEILDANDELVVSADYLDAVFIIAAANAHASHAGLLAAAKQASSLLDITLAEDEDRDTYPTHNALKVAIAAAEKQI